VRRYSKSLCLSALLISFSWMSTPVLANEKLSPDREWGKATGWRILWNEALQSCLAAVQYQDETIFWIGLNKNGEDGFIAAANAKWNFVKQGEQHEIQFVFDGSRRWDGEMAETWINGMPALEVDNVKISFIEDVARSGGLSQNYAKRKLTSFCLQGTRAALDGIAECARLVGTS
jgi:hypothetical protein